MSQFYLLYKEKEFHNESYKNNSCKGLSYLIYIYITLAKKLCRIYKCREKIPLHVK